MSLPSRRAGPTLAQAAALPLTVGTVAHAQTAAVITAGSFAVEPVRSLVPGTELAFDLRATPGTHATLQIVGATTPVPVARILAVKVSAPERIRPGDELSFPLSGVPGEAARLTVVNKVEIDDGRSRNFHHAVAPLLPAGTRVKRVDGAIVPR